MSLGTNTCSKIYLTVLYGYIILFVNFLSILMVIFLGEKNADIFIYTCISIFLDVCLDLAVMHNTLTVMTIFNAYENIYI